MIRSFRKSVNSFRSDERGQALPIIAFAIVCLTGMCGIGVDVARCYFVYRQLQASTDAAAMAGATALPGSNAITVATNYSSVAGGLNARSSLSGATMVSGYPKVVCLQAMKNQGVACPTPSNANAIIVKQQITIPMYFLRVVGKTSQLIGTSATASARGANPTPFNVAIILDTTLSMNAYDSNCGATQMSCALQGVQTLLQSLSPCAANQATCTVTNGVATNPVDQVALFTFPNVTTATASAFTNCTYAMPYQYGSQNYYYMSTGNYYYSMPWQTAYPYLPRATAYTFPPVFGSSYNPTGTTYQITNFLSDYRTSDTSPTLNQYSSLVKAAGGTTGCGGLAPPNYAGNYGTFYAGAIYAASAALAAQANAYPGSQNVIILLSDGDANAPQNFNGYPVMPAPANGNGPYPSYVNECAQAWWAAYYAAQAGTRVYTVAYGSPSGGCVTDGYNYPWWSACQNMTDMASQPQYFYSDYLQSGSGSTCYSSNSVTSLKDIFTSIAADLTVARLVPDNTT